MSSLEEIDLNNLIADDEEELCLMFDTILNEPIIFNPFNVDIKYKISQNEIQKHKLEIQTQQMHLII